MARAPSRGQWAKLFQSPPKSDATARTKGTQKENPDFQVKTVHATTERKTPTSVMTDFARAGRRDRGEEREREVGELQFLQEEKII